MGEQVINNIIKIQKIVRGFLTRKSLTAKNKKYARIHSRKWIKYNHNMEFYDSNSILEDFVNTYPKYKPGSKDPAAILDTRSIGENKIENAFDDKIVKFLILNKPVCCFYFVENTRSQFAFVRKPISQLEMHEKTRDQFSVLCKPICHLEEHEGGRGYFPVLPEPASELKEHQRHKDEFSVLSKPTTQLEEHQMTKDEFSVLPKPILQLEDHESNKNHFSVLFKPISQLEEHESNKDHFYVLFKPVSQLEEHQMNKDEFAVLFKPISQPDQHERSKTQLCVLFKPVFQLEEHEGNRTHFYVLSKPITQLELDKGNKEIIKGMQRIYYHLKKPLSSLYSIAKTIEHFSVLHKPENQLEEKNHNKSLGKTEYFDTNQPSHASQTSKQFSVLYKPLNQLEVLESTRNVIKTIQNTLKKPICWLDAIQITRNYFSPLCKPITHLEIKEPEENTEQDTSLYKIPQRISIKISLTVSESRFSPLVKPTTNVVTIKSPAQPQPECKTSVLLGFSKPNVDILTATSASNHTKPEEHQSGVQKIALDLHTKPNPDILTSNLLENDVKVKIKEYHTEKYTFIGIKKPIIDIFTINSPLKLIESYEIEPNTEDIEISFSKIMKPNKKSKNKQSRKDVIVKFEQSTIEKAFYKPISSLYVINSFEVNSKTIKNSDKIGKNLRLEEMEPEVEENYSDEDFINDYSKEIIVKNQEFKLELPTSYKSSKEPATALKKPLNSPLQKPVITKSSLKPNKMQEKAQTIKNLNIKVDTKPNLILKNNKKLPSISLEKISKPHFSSYRDFGFITDKSSTKSLKNLEKPVSGSSTEIKPFKKSSTKKLSPYVIKIQDSGKSFIIITISN